MCGVVGTAGALEHTYLARPDCIINEQCVHASRWQIGHALGQQWAARAHKADVVVPTSQTARPAAQSMAERLGLAYRQGFVANASCDRPFLMPDDPTRQAALRLKLNPIQEVSKNKRVLLVDDSVVRGTTMRQIATLVRTLRPRRLHLVVFSPPVRHRCLYGLDAPTGNELIANRAAPDELETWLCTHFGVDSVTYLTRHALDRAVGPNLCAACFDGDYPVTVSPHERALPQERRRPLQGADPIR